MQTTHSDDLYSALQAVLIRPNATRGVLITLRGQGARRPYNYREAICERLDSKNFFSNLFGVTEGNRHGIFVLAAFQPSSDSPEVGTPRELNYLAHAALGMNLYGDVIITSAERCGENQYLYNLGPICPNDAQAFLHIGRLPALLRPVVTDLEKYRPRELGIGVSVSVHECYREWWEAFSDTKKNRILQMDKKVLADLGDHLRTFLAGIVSVWCGLCGAKYRRLRLCRGCQCVAYCMKGCLRKGFEQHREICHILAGSNLKTCKCHPGTGCKEHAQTL